MSWKVVALLLAIIAFADCRRMESSHALFWQIPYRFHAHNSIAQHDSADDVAQHDAVSRLNA